MASAKLAVNLAAIAANYQQLKSHHAKHSVAAVVKANAYGLGIEAVAQTLHKEGCSWFFVANLAEAIELRGFLSDVYIGVFSGMFPGEEKEYIAHRLTPIINDLGQLERAKNIQAIVHVDTGMTRLGLSQSDMEETGSAKNILMLMSHLACASVPDHPKNAEQLLRLRQARTFLPHVPVSFANSSGHFLSEDYHFDLGRPGCALYGINPTEEANPMQHVATLSTPVLQIRTLDRDEQIGYGATCNAPKGSRIAIAGIGYADGYFRSLSNQGFGYVAGYKVELAGRVSMDMITLDISAIPEKLLTPDMRVELINNVQTVDVIAAQCGTIGYEIFTRLGPRIMREYY